MQGNKRGGREKKGVLPTMLKNATYHSLKKENKQKRQERNVTVVLFFTFGALWEAEGLNPLQ